MATKFTNEPLILTDYIRQNKTDEARDLSQVHYSGFQEVTSFSGYFTVEESHNSNLFFWYFPAANDFENAPLILWLNGGPGHSSLYGVFQEHGPFIINADLSVTLRDISWHKNHSVLYIDNPVGTGFSFTSEGFTQDQTQIGTHLYTALNQFFKVFRELQDKPFFAAGESYAGKYIPALCHIIHNNNPEAEIKINLHGCFIGNGFSDPENMFLFSDNLYQLGLIDRAVRDEMKMEETEAVKLIQEGNFTAATKKFQDIIWGGEDSLFYKATGLSNIRNYLPKNSETSYWEEGFVTLPEFKEALHVGGVDFGAQAHLVLNNLYSDITKSVAPWIADLLSHYRFLFFNGQLDLVIAYPMTENFLQKLNFSAAEEYKTAKRSIWHVDGDVAGYIKEAGNLTEVLVRDASHSAPVEQPKAVYDLLYKFVRNINFS